MATQRRSSGTRSRTGCITCKLRHVKCDETKPMCLRCQESGHKCEGYDNASQSQLRRRVKAIQNMSRRPLLSGDHRIVLRPETREERRWADFFHAQTVVAFSGFFDSMLWSYLIPQISEGEPTIRHAMVAIGAIHARYQIAADPTVADHAFTDQFVLQQYNKAIRHLIDRMSTVDSQNWELTLATCCLFICLEILRGKKAEALDHIDAGLKMLYQHEQRWGTPDRNTELYRELHQLLSRFNLEASFMGRLLCPLNFPSQDVPTANLTLSSLSHARNYLDSLMNKGLAFIRSVGLDRKPRDSQRQQRLELEQRKLCSEFDTWLVSLNKLIQRMGPWIQQSDQRASLNLKIYHHTSLIWVKTVLARDENVFDLYVSDFDAVVSYAGRVIQLTGEIDKRTNNQSKFCLDGQVIGPLYYAATKCRSPAIRRRAIDLLIRYGKIEGMWDAKRYAAVANLVMEVEESACLEVIESELDVDRHARVYECLQPEVMESNPCQVLLLFKPDGVDGDFQQRMELVHW
ncbi:C6 zinc finger domain protein [Aspergillus bombycis]|uniref:C6 zinc finger domain protein n=1 Tax=Aspergillus bombycis TaxID=109264 RepID=A0A1F8AGL6_9EURO|nr:C6 zinc finger domain protein [Aspergillus bombycis]OGM50822.1 C6 zinc finger domain protein [Aspergillus bombycis]